MAIHIESVDSPPKNAASTANSFIAALTAFDSQWSRSDRAMVEVLPHVIPPGGVHAVLGRRPSASPVYLTHWRTLLPTVCDVTARVLLPRLFDAESADACPLCAEIVRAAPDRPARRPR
jgi:hypothetical protein